jgi:carboxyl-terminal processing protease
MSEVTKSVFAAVAVVVAAGAVILGSNVRSKLDLGGVETTQMSGADPAYLASRDNGVDVPAADYFYELSEKLKKEYVEPVKDDQVLATGAVRGMVTSLNDPQSIFFSKESFNALLDSRQGKYHGIGVDLELVTKIPSPKPTVSAGGSDSSEINAETAIALGLALPLVQVADVVPGGPAAKAGIKPGDVVYSVDDHWVANLQEVADFRAAQASFLNKKLPKEQYFTLRNEIRKKTERALMPSKVRDKLELGEAGAITVVWMRNGQKIRTDLEKMPSAMPTVSAAAGALRVPFDSTSAQMLKAALAGHKSLTLDLRHNTNGDYGVMKECLALVAPAGRYGTIENQRNEKGSALIVAKGNPNPPSLTLLVDRSTSGSAEIFAQALSARGLAKLNGGQMGGDVSVREIVQLPDGTGYTLVTGTYKSAGDTTVVAQGETR